jgi:hypothetical protein
MHKCGFGQAYIDLLKRILTKFNLYLSELYCIFYEFWNPKRISGISKWKTKLETKKWCTVLGHTSAHDLMGMAGPSG